MQPPGLAISPGLCDEVATIRLPGAAASHPEVIDMAEFVSLAKALADNLADGDTVAFEGFTHLIPHAAAHEAIRQGRKDLTLVRMTPDLVYDQMIGMGCARK